MTPPLTLIEAKKLRTVCLAHLDKTRYVCLISHIMREQILMHFPPERHAIIKPAISTTWKALIADGTVVRGRGWAFIYWPAPVAYPQPWSAWVWRAARRAPHPKEAYAMSRTAEWVAHWAALGCPQARDYWSATVLSDKLAKRGA